MSAPRKGLCLSAGAAAAVGVAAAGAAGVVHIAAATAAAGGSTAHRLVLAAGGAAGVGNEIGKQNAVTGIAGHENSSIKKMLRRLPPPQHPMLPVSFRSQRSAAKAHVAHHLLRCGTNRLLHIPLHRRYGPVLQIMELRLLLFLHGITSALLYAFGVFSMRFVILSYATHKISAIIGEKRQRGATACPTSCSTKWRKSSTR